MTPPAVTGRSLALALALALAGAPRRARADLPPPPVNLACTVAAEEAGGRECVQVQGARGETWRSRGFERRCDVVARGAAPDGLQVWCRPALGAGDDAPPAAAAPPEPPPVPPVGDAQLAAAAPALGALAARLLAERPGNVVVSPVLVASSLAAVWAGARGGAARELATALAGDAPPGAARPDPAMALARGLTARFDGVHGTVLRTTTRVFVDAGVRVSAAYARRARAGGIAVEPLSLRVAPGPARRRIRTWGARATAGAVEALAPRHAVHGSTRLLVAGAGVLAGELEGFRPEDTVDAPFHLRTLRQRRGRGQRVTAFEVKDVTMLRAAGTFRHASLERVEVVELPLRGGDLALLVVLPRALLASGVIASVSQDELAGWARALRPARVAVELPRIALQDEDGALGDLLATRILRREGRRAGLLGRDLPGVSATAFDGDAAQLDGIGALPSGARLALGEVLHGLRVQLGESSAGGAPAPAPEAGTAGRVFRADHPFLFAVRERRSGAILFAGRVADPDPQQPPRRVPIEPVEVRPPAPVALSRPEGAAAPRQGAVTWRLSGLSGGIPRDAVERVAADLAAEIRACYEEHLAAAPDARARLTTTWLVAPDGTASRPATREAPEPQGELFECLNQHTTTWTFPPPADGARTAIQLDWELRPAAEER